jgi:hypothetical protein
MTAIRHPSCERHAISGWRVKILTWQGKFRGPALTVQVAGVAKVPVPADFAG